MGHGSRPHRARVQSSTECIHNTDLGRKEELVSKPHVQQAMKLGQSAVYRDSELVVLQNETKKNGNILSQLHVQLQISVRPHSLYTVYVKPRRPPPYLVCTIRAIDGS